jgi:hypothetical protein
LKGIETMAAANEFLSKEGVSYHNKHFTVLAQQAWTAFVPLCRLGSEQDILTSGKRIVGNDNTVNFGKICLQIEPQNFRFSMAKCRILVCHSVRC